MALITFYCKKWWNNIKKTGKKHIKIPNPSDSKFLSYFHDIQTAHVKCHMDVIRSFGWWLAKRFGPEIGGIVEKSMRKKSFSSIWIINWFAYLGFHLQFLNLRCFLVYKKKLGQFIIIELLPVHLLCFFYFYLFFSRDEATLHEALSVSPFVGWSVTSFFFSAY